MAKQPGKFVRRQAAIGTAVRVVGSSTRSSGCTLILEVDFLIRDQRNLGVAHFCAIRLVAEDKIKNYNYNIFGLTSHKILF